MNNGVKITISFVAGVAAGATAAWYVLKERYNKMMNEEIASFKEEYKERMEEKKAATAELEKTAESFKKAAEEAAETAKNFESFKNIVNGEGYYYVHEDNPFDDGILDRKYREKHQKGEPDEPSETRKKPYVIPPSELGDEQYDICVLTYYADGVLTNDYDEVIDNIEGTVGKESLKTFGQYEPDAVYVRNDELGIDYEINRDVRRYVDIGPDESEYDD